MKSAPFALFLKHVYTDVQDFWTTGSIAGCGRRRHRQPCRR